MGTGCSPSARRHTVLPPSRVGCRGPSCSMPYTMKEEKRSNITVGVAGHFAGSTIYACTRSASLGHVPQQGSRGAYLVGSCAARASASIGPNTDHGEQEKERTRSNGSIGSYRSKQ